MRYTTCIIPLYFCTYVFFTSYQLSDSDSLGHSRSFEVTDWFDKILFIIRHTHWQSTNIRLIIFAIFTSPTLQVCAIPLSFKHAYLFFGAIH